MLSVPSGTLPDDWSQALTRKGISKHDVSRLTLTAYQDAPGRVLPEPGRTFRAFELTPLDKVRVVILGLDPYPDRSQACGLAFSVPRGVAVPYSLARIYDKMNSEFIYGSFVRPTHGDISVLATRGVLLLNAALTVIEGEPNSHVNLWSTFTHTILELLNEQPGPIVFMLWGNHANQAADRVVLDESRHKVIRSTHPRYQESSRYPRFSETTPFVDANQFFWGRRVRSVNLEID